MIRSLLASFALAAALLPAAAQSVDAHLRVAPGRGAVAGWRDAAGHSLLVTFHDPGPGTDWDGTLLTITLDSLSFDARTLPGIPTSEVSLLLHADPDSASLSLAHARDRRRFDLPPVFNLDAAPEPVTRRCSVLRHSSTLTPASAPVPSCSIFPDVAALEAYISTSVDPLEALWAHYDHRTTPLRSDLGGRYTLATVRCPDSDSYYIIYIAGADPASAWRPLDIKGTLTPSPLSGLFDLSWFTSDHISVSHHSWASVDDLLTLSLPPWDATLRFSRVPRCTSDLSHQTS